MKPGDWEDTCHDEGHRRTCDYPEELSGWDLSLKCGRARQEARWMSGSHGRLREEGSCGELKSVQLLGGIPKSSPWARQLRLSCGLEWSLGYPGQPHPWARLGMGEQTGAGHSCSHLHHVLQAHFCLLLFPGNTSHFCLFLWLFCDEDFLFPQVLEDPGLPQNGRHLLPLPVL